MHASCDARSEYTRHDLIEMETLHSRAPKRLPWSQLKRVFISTNLSSLFFATFTTLISVLATAALPAAQALGLPGDWIDLVLLLTSLLTFFLSAVFWYVALLIFEVWVPVAVATSSSVEAYIESAISSPTLLTPEERMEAAYRETFNWDKAEFSASLARYLITIFGITAATTYVLAFLVFFLSILGFLRNLAHGLWPQLKLLL